MFGVWMPKSIVSLFCVCLFQLAVSSESVSQSALEPNPVSGECVDGKLS